MMLQRSLAIRLMWMIGLVATVLVLAATSAQAVGRADPAEAALARIAKIVGKRMQAGYGATVPGIRFTTMACTYVTGYTVRCKAGFTLASKRMKGVMQVKVEVDRATGAIRARTTSVSCNDSKTGAKVRC